jgi:hypothetical protein
MKMAETNETMSRRDVLQVGTASAAVAGAASVIGTT